MTSRRIISFSAANRVCFELVFAQRHNARDIAIEIPVLLCRSCHQTGGGTTQIIESKNPAMEHYELHVKNFDFTDLDGKIKKAIEDHFDGK